MSKKKDGQNLVVTAHPDDETLFMGGLIMSERKRPWKVICVTDGNADGQGAKRKAQFEAACRLLKVRDFEMWTFPDVYEKRLDVDRLTDRLSELSCPPVVYTHGIVGEYGHPHHQDVSWAVHRVFEKQCPVYSVAYNCMPQKTVVLSRAVFARKARILSEIYGSETQRFAHLIPTTFAEGFVKVDGREVQGIYRFLIEGKQPKQNLIKAYERYWPHFRLRFSQPPRRLF